MSLRFIAGKSGTGKSGLCLKELAAADSGVPIIYIVPEQYSLLAERDLIRAAGKKCVMRAKVLSFRRLSFSVLAAEGGGRRALLGDAGRAMALRKIAGGMEGLEFLPGMLPKPGFMTKLTESVSELFRLNISPEALMKYAESAGDSPALCTKLRDLAAVYSGYQKFLESEYISAEEALSLLAEKLRTSQYLRNAEIWIDGFYGFTPQELLVIERILMTARRVTVALTLDPDVFPEKTLDESHGFFEPWRTAQSLISIARRTGTPMEPPVFLRTPRRFRSASLRALESEFFSAAPRQRRDSSGISIFEAANRFAEAEDAAEKIIRLARDKGLRFRDMAVVARGVSDYEKIISVVFGEYGIPYFLDSKRDIKAHPLIKTVLCALDAIIYDFRYEDVFAYIKTGLTGLSREESDVLENYALAYGIKGYKWFIKPWDFGRGIPGEEKSRLNEIKNRVTAPFAHLRANAKKRLPVRELCAGVFDFLECINIRGTMEALAGACESAGDIRGAREQTAVYSALSEVFQKLSDILGDEKITLGEFRELINSGLEESSLGAVPASVDQVVVGDIERTRLPEIEALFVLGANDGVLPKPPETAGIFSDAEAELLSDIAGGLIKNGKRRAFEENYLIYIGLTRPRTLLRLSYSTGDPKGRAMRPSPLIGRIKRIFPGIATETEPPPESMESVCLPAPALHRLGPIISAAAAGQEFPKVWGAVLDYLWGHGDYSQAVEGILSAAAKKAPEPPLPPREINRLYGGTIGIGATGLSAFAACPFLFFVRYGLSAKERRLYEVKTLDLGSLFHGVLEAFSKDLAKDGIPWRELDREEISRRVDAAVDMLAPDMGESVLFSRAGYEYLITRLKNISRRAVWALSEHIKSGDFEPLGFEIGFGVGEALPPIELPLPGGKKLVMAGKIDRVDMLDRNGKKYVKVIDYKSGSKDFSLQEIYYGLELQLMLYMDAFLEKGGPVVSGERLPGGVFYFRIRDPILQSSAAMEDEEIARLMLREFKMSGLVLKDREVVRAMDRDAVKSSEIINVRFKTDGELSDSSCSADLKSYKKLLELGKKRAMEIGGEIAAGNIGIKPYKLKNKAPCDYCRYRGICRFDPDSGDAYRQLKPIKDSEIWEKI